MCRWHNKNRKCCTKSSYLDLNSSLWQILWSKVKDFVTAKSFTLARQNLCLGTLRFALNEKRLESRLLYRCHWMHFPKWSFLHMCPNPKNVPFKENISSIHHCWSPPTHSAVIVFCWQCVRESFSRYMKFIPSTSWKCTHGNFWQTVEIYFMDCHKIDLKMLPTNSCDAFARSWWLTSSHWLQRRSSGSFKSRQKFSTAS